MPEPLLPTPDDVKRAARQLAGIAHRTPVVTSRTVDDRVDANVFFKCENVQRAGAFKFRGAYNALSRLPPAQQKRGVVAYSSGNHAQAVALAGQLLDIPCTIVMPTDAPAVKRAATEHYGGQVVTYDRERESREAIGCRLAEERGLAVIPPFDHPDVIAGQGTAALELLEDVGSLDVLLVPCGGGGLLSGAALIASALSPGLSGYRCRARGWGRCDAIIQVGNAAVGAQPADGRRRSPDAIARHAHFSPRETHVADMTTVDDVALLRTMFFLWERMKLVVEPTGALGAAAVLESTIADGARRIGVVLSGGNVDLGQVAAWRSRI